jgi:Flp pilus assembly protein TadG
MRNVHRRKLLVDRRGTALLEMALLIPIFSLLVLGIIEIGRYAELSIEVSNAARAGVQYGAQSVVTAADSTGITNAAKQDAANLSGLQVNNSQGNASGFVLCGCSSSGTPGATCPATGCSSSDYQVVYVEVDTQGQFDSLFHYPGIPSPIIINGRAQMRVAQ